MNVILLFEKNIKKCLNFENILKNIELKLCQIHKNDLSGTTFYLLYFPKGFVRKRERK